MTHSNHDKENITQHEANKKKNELYKKLYIECEAMIAHLGRNGKPIPQLAEKLIGEEGRFSLSPNELLNLHKQLSKKVLPAKPTTLVLLCKEENINRFFKFLGPVSLIRRLMLTAIISLIVFVLMSTNDMVNSASLAQRIWDDSGWVALNNIIFIMSIAALGSCFANLYQANKFIIEGTYNPNYEGSYWIRFLLGIISGMILAAVVSTYMDADQIEQFSIPIISLIGGFSASLLHDILKRLIEAFETLLTGKGNIKEKERSMINSRLHEQDSMQTKLNVYNSVSKFATEDKIIKESPELQKKMNELLDKIEQDL